MFDGSVHNYGIHEAEFGIQAGIGIDYAITQKVGLHAAARYAPSYSLLHSDYNGSTHQKRLALSATSLSADSPCGIVG